MTFQWFAYYRIICTDLSWLFKFPLLVEDLDNTLEAPVERMSPKGDTDPEPCKQEVWVVLFAEFFNIPKNYKNNTYSLWLSVFFRTMWMLLHLLSTMGALALSQAWATKALRLLIIIAALWCWVLAPLLQPLLMHPSALTHHSWLPWS